MQTKFQQETFSKITLFTGILLIGFIIVAYVSHFLGAILHYEYPLNTMLFAPSRAGDDLFSSVETLRSGDIYAQQGSVYFPACVLFLYPFLYLSDGEAFAVYAGLVILFALPFVYFSLKKTDLLVSTNVVLTAIIVFFSYPVLFCLDRGNLEGLSFIFFMGFAWFFRKRQFWLAAVLLGIAASTKMYPVVFGALLLREKKWREFLLVGSLALALNIVPAACLPGGILGTFSRLFENQRIANLVLGMTFGGVPYGISLFSLVKISCYFLFNGRLPEHVLGFYSVPCAVITLYCFYFAIRKLGKIWEAIFFVFAPWLIFPQISYAYKLIWLLVPVCLMFEDESLSIFDVWCFGLLFIPKTILPTGLIETSFSILIDPALIILVAVRIYLRNRRATTCFRSNFAANKADSKVSILTTE